MNKKMCASKKRIVLSIMLSLFFTFGISQAIYAQEQDDEVIESIDTQQDSFELEPLENDQQESEPNQQDEKRNIIFIGDSYQVGDKADTNFLNELKNEHEQEFGQIYDSSKGSHGFSREGLQFITLIQNIEDSIEDKNAITDIVVTGGYNDWANIDGVYTEMEKFVQYSHTMYPNAKLWLAPVGWTKTTSTRKELVAQSIGAWKTSGNSLGFHVMSTIQELFHNPYLLGKDTFHPNNDGQKELARCLYEELTTGSCTILQNGLVKENNGQWAMYRFGKIDRNATGLYLEEKSKQYLFLRNGFQDLKYIGIALNSTTGKWTFVQKGTTGTYTGIAKSIENGRWYFCRKGILDWNFTGVGKSIENGKWYHCKKGALDWNFTGLSKSVENGKWYFSKKGALDWNFTGIAKSVENGKWYFARKGALDWSFTGVAKSVENGKWYYCKKVPWTGIIQD